nr:peptidase M61 [Polymorphobacter sp.]
MIAGVSARQLTLMVIAGGVIAAGATAQTAPLPVQVLDRPAIAAPVDHAFAGTIAVDVEQADVAHKLFVVRERIPVQQAGALTLLYPRWESASHGPSLTVTDLAGLEVRGDGRPLAWRRDPVEPHAFHLNVPAGVRSIEVRYEIVGGDDELSPDLVVVPWQRLIIYPAGWYARNLTVAAAVAFPAGLQPRTSLQILDGPGGVTRFAPVSFETLLDSPVYAARFTRHMPLTAPGPAAVSLDLIARRPGDLVVPPERITELQRMVEQTRIVFGTAPYPAYAFLARMEDGGSSGGTEHRRSSEIAMTSDYFRDWPGQLNNRDILAHEFVHAWNGLYRTPADLWAPTPNVPQGGSLLWVYEGQTEFWGRVIAARAGLRSRDETLDKLALDAAEVVNRPGRAWRALSDDVTYPAFMLHQPVPWRDWQRRKDYYLEGVMLWLDVDALLREQSGGRRGIDDFARRFFAGASPEAPTRTFVFDDVSSALNGVAPYDWAGFLRRWVDGHAVDVAAGLARQGWRLIYTDTPTATFSQNEAELGVADLTYSIGLTVTDSGVVRSVAWNGPAFRAGMAPRTKIVAVGGVPFMRAALIKAVRTAAKTPVAVTFQQDERSIEATLDYRGTLRYPRLAPIPGQPDRLTALLAPRG